MKDRPSQIVVPLRSNAKSLVAGSGIAALRRRLKVASVLFDEVLLEGGALSISAGPEGTMTMPIPPDDGFQTTRARHLKPGQRFVLAIGDPDSGGPALRNFIDSETTINWRPTLEPFGQELPDDCDWMRRVSAQRNPEAKKLAEKWTRLDSRNGVLAKEIPVDFARHLVIQHANADLALAAIGGLSIMQDPLHRQVMAARFADTEWRPSGFVLPVVLPDVGHLNWEQVAGVRRHRSLQRFRDVLNEVEFMALDEANSTGDIESATHHAYEAYLASAAGEFSGLPGLVKRTFGGLAIGSLLGMATASWTGTAGVIAGTAIGSVPGMIGDGRAAVRARRRSGWVMVHQQLKALGTAE